LEWIILLIILATGSRGVSPAKIYVLATNFTTKYCDFMKVPFCYISPRIFDKTNAIGLGKHISGLSKLSTDLV
jgi:hypothetical protein